VLEYLTNSGNDATSNSSPWIFRIGILNPAYNFPASLLLKSMAVRDEDHEDKMNIEEEEGEDDENSKLAYLDELGHRYIAYTHGTVVEFTQDEGHVGLPGPMAAALLDPTRRHPQAGLASIPARRTTDPAKQKNVPAEGHHDGNPMDSVSDEEMTPGHLAYGAFNVPDLPIEVALVRIPKGKRCKLVPTPESLAKGFYNLKDVKIVLEQSLIRTRATLSVGDIVYAWHRGVKFDLKVSEVSPATYQTVTCINTDIEVDFGEDSVPESDVSRTQLNGSLANVSARAGSGFTLGSSLALVSSKTAEIDPTLPTKNIELLEEPPTSQKENVCTVQIRAKGELRRRRFDITRATLGDLFAFASTVAGGVDTFQLVTRFPRRILRLTDNSSATMTLHESGLQAGQELFMVENI
jgi:hypothetical protein